jgi:spore coat protein U-like protein
MYKAKKIAIVILTLLFSRNYAYAATATNTFGVSATVIASCTVSATAISFGNYVLAQLTASGTVTAICTTGTTYVLSLNAGTTVGATVAARLLANGANTLPYNLYTSNAYLLIWGDGTLGTSQMPGGAATYTGTGAAQIYTVYGKIPANQTSTLGAYSDTVTVTVAF